MNWLRWFLGSADPDDMIDYVQVTTADDPRPAKLAAAAQRYGKPFAIEKRVPRKTEASARLREIEARSNVVPIMRPAK